MTALPGIRLLSATVVIALVSACASTPAARSGPAPVALPSSSTARLAIAHVTGASGSLVSGTLRLVPSGNGVRVSGAIGGLVPGSRHGLHVHVNGDCSAADASAAGDLFMPTTAGPMRGRHPHPVDSDIVADADGVAHVDLALAQRALGGGANDIAGRAIVVHSLPDVAGMTRRDDLRIGCGVITVAPSP